MKVMLYNLEAIYVSIDGTYVVNYIGMDLQNRLIDILCSCIPELYISLDYTDRCEYIYIPLGSSVQAYMSVTDLTQNEVMELLMNFNTVKISSIESETVGIHLSHSEGIMSIQDLYPLIIRKTLRCCRDQSIDYMSVADDLFNLVIVPNIRFGWDEDLEDREVIIPRLLRDIEINFNNWLNECKRICEGSTWIGSDESQQICSYLNDVVLSEQDLEVIRRYRMLVQDLKIIGRLSQTGRVIFHDQYTDMVVNLRDRDDYEVCDLLNKQLLSCNMSSKLLKCLRDLMV